MPKVPTGKKNNPEKSDGACGKNELDQAGMANSVQVSQVVIECEEYKRNDCKGKKGTLKVFADVLENQKRERYD